MNALDLIGREHELFSLDVSEREEELKKIITRSSFLVLGGAGSIGQAVTKELFKRNPKTLHVVDLSENNLVELVRDIRSSFGYITGDFQTFSLDIGSKEYDSFWNSFGHYDYILNLSALKHVRSEKDPFTLMRLVNTNIFNTTKTLDQAIAKGVKNYFCVSTDKAANPVNMMGASKRIMEMFVHEKSEHIQVSMARFANVAFSDGSLLHGFNNRIAKRQPLVAPQDVKRYFVIPKEAGELCLMACIFGQNRDIFFPKLDHDLNLITFSDIALKYLHHRGLKPFICQSEEEARTFLSEHTGSQWPCYFSSSDTTGEKSFEEFYTENETIDNESFKKIGVIKNDPQFNSEDLRHFENSIQKFLTDGIWEKTDLVHLFTEILPNFMHEEKGKFLDAKM